MATLTGCLKKAGKVIHADDKTAILARAKELRADGTATAEAAKQAVQEQLAKVAALLEQAKPQVLNQPAYHGTPQGEQARAQISFGPSIADSGAIISLLENADLSSFIHEVGHLFLEIQADLAARIQANIDAGENVTEGERQIVADMNKLLAWFGINETPELSAIGAWHAMTLEQKREHHETFARGWERYAFEGNSPNLELQTIFQRFAAWMKSIYRTLTSLNVNLTDEVRGVMDRMIATEDQIKEAETARAMGPLFTEQGKMSTEAWAAYQAQGEKATQTAVDKLQARALADMKWLSNARAAKLRELQAKADGLRDEIRAEVTRDVMSRPVYRAWQFLTGKDEEGVEPTHGKLHTPSLQEAYGNHENSFWKVLSDKHMTSPEGMAPDVLAETMGFPSGDAMVRELADARPPRDLIRDLTDQRMLQEHGELSTPEGLDKATTEALANKVRTRFLAQELQALEDAGKAEDKPGKDGKVRRTASALDRAAEAYAGKTIGAMKIEDIKPHKFEAAATRAAKLAAKAHKAGKTAEAAMHKRSELIQLHAAKAAHEALAEVDKALDYFKRVQKPGNIPAKHHEQIVSLLDLFDLRASTSSGQRENRQSFMAWTKSQLAAGQLPPNFERLLSKAQKKAFALAIQARDDDGELIHKDEEDQAEVLANMLDAAEVRHYKEVPVDELMGLKDTIKQIEHIGKRTKKVLTDRKNREFSVVVGDMRDRIVSVAEKMGRKAGDTRTPNDKTGQTKLTWRGFFHSQIKAANHLWIMDGEDGGPLTEHLMLTANAAGNGETLDVAKAHDAIQALLKPVKDIGNITDRAIEFKTIGRSLNRQARIVMAMNLGNASNEQRLLGGEGWTRADIQPVLDTLTAADWQFVQGMWDHFESYRDRVGAMEELINGVAPEWIEARALTVKTADGQTLNLRGGYAPVIFDPRASGKAASFAAEKDAKAMMQAARVAATVSKSFTKQRVDEVKGRPLLLSLDAMIGGVQDTIHYLHWQPWIIDANRMIKALDEPIRTYYGAEWVKQLRDWAGDNAAGMRPARDAAERAVVSLARNISFAGLAFNVMSAASQVTGYSQSVAVIGGRWMGRGLAHVMRDRTKAYHEATEKSVFMRKRASTRMRDLAEINGTVQDKGKVREFMDTAGYAMMMTMQTAVDLPTWWGAYEKAIDQIDDEDRAVALADQAVTDAQGSGMLKDLSSLERQTGAIRLLTGFMSFMNTTLNVNYRVLKSDRTVGKKVVDLMLVNAIPTILMIALKAALTPGDSGDDEPEEIAKKYAIEQTSFLLGQMVGLREIGQLGAAAFGEKSGDYGGAVGMRMFGDILKLAKQVGQGEMDDSLRKAVINAAGDTLRIPAAQINRTITGAEALADGETDNPFALAFGFQHP